MSAPITLTVVGVPASQGSKVRTKTGHMLDGTSPKARASLAEWRRAVADACRTWLAEHPAPPLAEPIRVTIRFRFALPKSDPYRWAHTTTPDLDKTLRATFDALVHGGLLADDRFIFDADVQKHYCRPDETAGATIIVAPDGATEALRRAGLKEEAATIRRAAKAAS